MGSGDNHVQFPFPLLVCDVGGTNVRSSLVAAPGGPLEALPARHTEDFPGLAEELPAGAPMEHPLFPLLWGAQP